MGRRERERERERERKERERERVYRIFIKFKMRKFHVCVHPIICLFICVFVCFVFFRPNREMFTHMETSVTITDEGHKILSLVGNHGH